MEIRTLIIEDDTDSRMILKDFLAKQYPEIIIVGEAATIKESSVMVQQLLPELILMDIELPDGTAFDLLNNLESRVFEVIFITAYNEYAVKAFRQAAIDYILKPLSYGDLSEAVQKAKKRIQEKNFQSHWQTLFYNFSQKESYEKKLAIATSEGFVFIPVKEIVRLESHSNYTYFHFLQRKKLVSSRTLGYYEDLLPQEYFCRVHHSHIVNISFTEKYIKGGAGGSLLMPDGTMIAVSQRKREEVYNRLVKG